ncbi:MAG TPA: GTP pyrophosphokinase family protein [Candidatus Caccomorpha excrementavium]|nr:GTP pyrophosphokinase family protein [Candidatus Caccomorpha excrementavium]
MELPIFYNQSDEWGKTLLLYDSALKELNTRLEIINNDFKLAHQYNPIEHITSRIKSSQSIAKKIRKLGMELTVENIVNHVNDVAGIRIICSFTSDIYRIAELLSRQSDIRILRVKDYIQNPKPNGYMSYHMIVTVPVFLSDRMVETKAEIQIRTIAMDFWASLEHKIYYKFEGNAPDYIRRELKECAELVAFLDKKMLSINEEIKDYARLEEFKAMAAGAFVSVQESVMGAGQEGEAYAQSDPEEEILSDYREVKEEDKEDTDMGMLEAMKQRVISENAGVYQTGNEEADTGENPAGGEKEDKKQNTYTDKVPFVGDLFAGGKKKKKRDLGLNGA